MKPVNLWSIRFLKAHLKQLQLLSMWLSTDLQFYDWIFFLSCVSVYEQYENHVQNRETENIQSTAKWMNQKWKEK